MESKNTYYLDFTTSELLASKELLKSMPVFFNRVYFCKKYANALWSGESEEHFSNICMICREEDMKNLRQIIKSNFLYISGWDSLNYSESGDYGFSFIAGKVKYILMPFTETDKGYIIKSYDVDAGFCYTTNLEVDKNNFLVSAFNENGDLVRTCDFNLEDINKNNTGKKIAEKKAHPTVAIYDNKGYALASLEYVLAIIISSFVVAWILYLIIRVLT